MLSFPPRLNSVAALVFGTSAAAYNRSMLDHLISQIDKEIARLQQARKLLAGGGGGVPSPFAAKTTVNKRRALSSGTGGIPSRRVRKATRKKRALSPEARAKIAAAQKARWAKVKKSAK